MTEKFDRAMLAHFTGTENYYQHSLMPDITFTDGAHYVAETAGAYWLLDAIVSWQLDPKVKAEAFQVWELKVGPDRQMVGAVLTCEDGDGREVARQEIPFTDFPEPGIEMWFSNNVIYLPSEH